jgi:hypothetical protein
MSLMHQVMEKKFFDIDISVYGVVISIYIIDNCDILPIFDSGRKKKLKHEQLESHTNIYNILFNNIFSNNSDSNSQEN